MNRNISRFALCLLAFLLGAMVALGSEPLHSEVKQIDFYSLNPDTRLKLFTETRVIELVITNPIAGEAVARVSQDGATFGLPKNVILMGATRGQQRGALSLIEMGVIRTGLKLELGLRNRSPENRLLTQPLNRIELSNNPDSVH